MGTGQYRRVHRRFICAALVVVAVLAAVMTASVGSAGAAGPPPIAVTPYSGFNPILTRAPYVTDLTQTSADVNWATTDGFTLPGSLKWGPSGNCTQNTATIPQNWKLPDLHPSANEGTSVVSPQFTVVSTNEYQRTVTLTGLSPGTSYCYEPFSGGTNPVNLIASTPHPTQSFTTLAAAGSSAPVTFDVVGDLGETLQSASVAWPNNLNPDQAAIDSLIGSSGASFVLTAGDVAYSGGSQSNYGDLKQTGSDISNIFGPSYWPQLNGLPVFAGEGNHGQNTTGLHNWPESQNATNSNGVYAYDSYPAPTLDGTNPASYPDAWYAFSTGGARIYVLDAAWADSNVGTGSLYQDDHDEHWTPSSPEYKWLAADLASHPGGVKAAVFHFPLRSDNSSQSTDTYLDNTGSNPNSLEALLANNGVKVAFNGHAHTYQRIAPSGSGHIVNYVTGGGGAILEPVGGGSACTGFTQSGVIYAIGWSPTSNSGSGCGTPAPQSAAQVFNFLKVTVNGGTLTVTPINAAGQSFDQQSYTYTTSSTTVIDTPPPALTKATSATISFHATGGGTSFTCSLDGAAATACTSPVTYTGLAAGPHNLVVTGAGASPATASWTIDTSPPSVPTNLAGAAASPTQVNLTWTASNDDTGVTGYDVYRNGSLLATTSGTGTGYTDSTAAPSTTYQYSVAAFDGAGNVSQQTTPPVSVITPAAPAGPTFIQSAGSSTTTVTLPAPSHAGDLLVLTSGVFTGASQPITAVADGKNTWTKVGAYSVAGQYSDGEMWYAPNAASVSSVTVTTGASTVALQVQEFGGVATTSPLDGSIGAAASSTTASSGTVTPTGSNDLAVGFVAGHSNAQAITVSSPGYTAQPQQTTTSPSPVTVRSGYQDVGAPGPQSFSGTFGSAMYWAAGAALFKAGSVSPPNDFSISPSPSSATVSAGSGTTSTISTAVTSGAAQSVALSATGAPSGATVSFNPQTVNAGQSSTMTVTTSTSTPTGTSSITVTGTGSSAIHSTTFSLTVNPAPVAPTITSANSTTFTQGTAGTFTVTATGSPVPTLAESGSLPTGVTFVDNGNGTATLSGTPAVGSAATYPITITATNGIGTPASQSFTLTVNPPVSNDFSITPSPTSATVTAGSPATSTISTAVTSGATQSVALSATGAPTGALVSFNPQVLNAGQSSTMTVTTSSTTPTGTTSITVTGTGSSATHSTTFSLTVNPPPPNDFSIAASPTSATVTAGSPATSTISTAVTSGTTQSVALSATGAPAGTTVSFNPQVLNAGQSSTMTVTTSSTTPTGTTSITVTGTGSSATHSTTFSLTVNPVTSTKPALVQTASATETATSTALTGSFPSATKAGDLLVLSASEYTGATNNVTSVTDSAGNTWARIGAYDVSGHNSDGEMWYSANAKAATTVTVHVATAAMIAFEVQEFSGVATTGALDVSAGTSNTGTSAASGVAAASTANELVVGFVAGHNNAEAITVTSPGYLNQGQQNSTGTVASIVSGYQVIGAPGSQSYAGTFGTAMYWAAGVAVFKPAG